MSNCFTTDSGSELVMLVLTKIEDGCRSIVRNSLSPE